ncbi:MAG: prenyltransferase [Candidatus Micrarchaeia archaeon]
MIKDYIIEIFEPTLLFGFLSSFVGLSAAIYLKVVNFYLGILAIIGVIIVQITVNLIDDYVDYKIGIDKETVKTKFSGGSALVVGNSVTTKGILAVAVVALIIAAVIGIYILGFLSAGIATIIFLIMMFGFVATVFYARYLTHVPFFAEPFVVLSFAIVGLAVFLVAQNSVVNAYPLLLFACLPAGLQVGVAMIANELPDKKVDKKYGRRNMVIMLSHKKMASKLYVVFQVIAIGLILIGIATRFLPITFLITLIVLPLYYKVWRGISNYKNPKNHEKTMGLNALSALLLELLISIAFLI